MGFRACLLAAVLALGCSSDPLVTPPDSEESPAPGATAAPTGAPTGVPTGTGSASPGPSPDAFHPDIEYPSGPYGRGLGAVLDDIDFLGWRDPVASNYAPESLERVSLSDFYDPTGQTTKLLVINASALWCTVCQAEMRQIKNENLYQLYRERGVEILGTLFEDDVGAPATPNDLKIWGSSRVRQIAFPLVLDPSLRMGLYFTSDATPL
ncbi:MAG TPA: redoxin domain-containing protein, partial [Polyangiaceae bacterium]